MTDDPNTPLQINPSAVQSALLMSLRVGGIVAGAFGVAASAMKTHDITDLVAWIKSDNIAQLTAALTLLGSFGAALTVTIRKKWREVYLTYHADNSKAVLTKPVDDPKKV